MHLSEKIQHIVVLMLENRSFDSLLGGLYAPGECPGFNGLTGAETNPDLNGKPVRIQAPGGRSRADMTVPDPDPGELWDDINTQLFGCPAARNAANPPLMDGFVRNYLTQQPHDGKRPAAQDIMHYYRPDQVPVLSQLAKSFAVCDQWFASAPCQTWPNRFFVHTGSANGYENNNPLHFPYLMETVFNRLQGKGKDWRIYFHDFPQSLTLTRLWPHLDHFHAIETFLEDAENGELPHYSFIEPRYFADFGLPNDQHPPHHVGHGDRLIARIYRALRASPNWEKTLFIITYDEHGGCYDHVPPPAATPPSTHATTPFNFDRYGVRVPAVLVSPWIRPATLLQIKPQLPHRGPPFPFDHTSIIATLRACFDLGKPLSRRDAVAPDLASVLNLAAPTNYGPDIDLPDHPYPESEYAARLAAAQALPLNHGQQAMAKAARWLGTPLALLEKAHELRARLPAWLPGAFPASRRTRGRTDALAHLGERVRHIGKR